MKNIIKVVVIAAIAVTLVGIAFMGFSYAKEAELKMEAMKYMEDHWYSGYGDDCEIIAIHEMENGHYDVTYTTTEDDRTHVNRAELTL